MPSYFMDPAASLKREGIGFVASVLASAQAEREGERQRQLMKDRPWLRDG